MPDSVERFVTPSIDAFVNYWRLWQTRVEDIDACRWVIDPEAFTATIQFFDNRQTEHCAHLALKPLAQWRQLTRLPEHQAPVDNALVLQLHQAMQTVLIESCPIAQLIGVANPFETTMRVKLKPYAGFAPRVVAVRIVGARKAEAGRAVQCLVSMPNFDLAVEDMQSEFETKMRKKMGMTPLIGRFDSLAVPG